MPAPVLVIPLAIRIAITLAAAALASYGVLCAFGQKESERSDDESREDASKK